MTVWDWYVRRGRLSRGAFLLQYVLPGVLAPLVAGWVDTTLDLPRAAFVVDNGWFILAPAGLLQQTVLVLLLVPSIAGTVARLHDCNRSAWWLLLAVIPLVGTLLITVAVLFFRGDRSHNDYGPAPESRWRDRWAAVLRRPRVPA